MAINPSGVAKSQALIMKNSSLLQMGTCVAMIAMKAVIATQLDGIYDLLFPLINVDFATRLETQTWNTTEFAKHQGSGAHLPPGVPNVCSPVTTIPMFMMLPTMTVKTEVPTPILPSSVAMAQDAGIMPEPGAPGVAMVKVKAGGKANPIGYFV